MWNAENHDRKRWGFSLSVSYSKEAFLSRCPLLSLRAVCLTCRPRDVRNTCSTSYKSMTRSNKTCSPQQHKMSTMVHCLNAEKLRNNDIPSENCRYMYTRVRRLSLFKQEAYAITCTCISLPYSSNIIHTIIIYLSS